MRDLDVRRKVTELYPVTSSSPLIAQELRIAPAFEVHVTTLSSIILNVQR
jgi:hypothetical protein